MAQQSKTKRLSVPLLQGLAGALALSVLTAPAQVTPARPATPSPFAPRQIQRPPAAPTPARPFFERSLGASQQQAPRDTKLVEKKFEELPNQELSEYGEKALGIDPEKWKHAETENFLLHYRRVTEAQKVAREVEYYLWYVATTLGASKDRYQRKSHVYVFEDDAEWKSFLGMTQVPAWSASFARGDELFLNVRGTPGGGGFNSTTLAHETTHAVVARLFPRKRWPLWLSEGFAEYMGGASVAARKGQTSKRYQTRLRFAEMPLEQLEQLQSYPADEVAVAQLYQSSEKFVRFLMNELPKDRIVTFIDYIVEGKGMKESVLGIYGDKVRDWDSFMRRYERFTK